MENYSIEIELVDTAGNVIKKPNCTCLIDKEEITKGRTGKFVKKFEFEEKATHNIDFNDLKIILNFVKDKEEDKINVDKTKLKVIVDKKKVAVDKETILYNVAWDINEKKQIIVIKVIEGEELTVDNGEEEVENETEKEVVENTTEESQSNDKISKILAKAKK